MLLGPVGDYTSSYVANIGQHVLPTVVGLGARTVTDPVSLVSAAVLPIGTGNKILNGIGAAALTS